LAKSKSRHSNYDASGLNAHLLIQMAKGNFLLLNPFHYLFGVDILFLAGISLLLIATWKQLSRKP
jgi:hypothetical protein